MLTVSELRRHMTAAAAELGINLTIKEVNALAARTAARATIPARPRPRTVTLTERRLQVLDGLARGEDSVQTASRLKVGAASVKSHRQELYRQLGAVNAAHAVDLAWRLGVWTQAATRPGGEES